MNYTIFATSFQWKLYVTSIILRRNIHLCTGPHMTISESKTSELEGSKGLAP